MKIDFEIGNKKYKIAGLTVGDWYHIQDEMLLNPHSALSITSYLSGCPEEELRKLPQDSWSILWETVQKFIEDAKTPKEHVAKYITSGGIKYHLINQDKMSIGEFADLDILISSPGSEKKLHEIAAILYRPLVDGEIESYNTETYKQRAELFKLLPLQESIKVLNFFLLFAHRYLSNTVDYLNQQLKEETVPENKEMLQTTLRLLQEAGTKLLSFSLTKESWSLNQFPGWESASASIGLRISQTGKGKKNWNSKRVLQNINAN